MKKRTAPTTRDAARHDPTRDELAAIGRELDARPAGEGFGPLTPAGAERLAAARRRGPGRPRKPAGEKSRRVLLTIEPALLAAVDRRVAAAGTTRSVWLVGAARSALGLAADGVGEVE